MQGETLLSIIGGIVGGGVITVLVSLYFAGKQTKELRDVLAPKIPNAKPHYGAAATLAVTLMFLKAAGENVDDAVKKLQDPGSQPPDGDDDQA